MTYTVRLKQGVGSEGERQGEKHCRTLNTALGHSVHSQVNSGVHVH